MRDDEPKHPVNRREFLESTGRFAAALGWAGASLAPGCGPEEEPPAPAQRPVVDTHMHVWANDPVRYPFPHPYVPGFQYADVPAEGTTEMLLEDMDRNGVTHSILVQVIYHGWDNSYVVDSLRAHPDRFRGHGLIDPTDPNVADRLEYWVKEHGLSGMRFSPIYYLDGSKGGDGWLNHPHTDKLWKRARQLGAVFNFFIATQQLPKGRRKNKFWFSLRGFDGVVPSGQGGVACDAKLSHLGIGDFEAGLVDFLHQVGSHAQPGRGASGAQVFEDGFITVERAAGPVFADFTKQPVFDGIPLGRGGGVVGDGHAQSMAVAEAMLQVEFPGARGAAVAAAAVGEDLESFGLGIAHATLGAPPLFDAVDGKCRGVGGRADEDRAGIGLRIVDPVGDGAALGFGAKVVILHQFGDAVPLGAGILERANEFLLLGIDADHRGVLDGAALA